MYIILTNSRDTKAKGILRWQFGDVRFEHLHVLNILTLSSKFRKLYYFGLSIVRKHVCRNCGVIFIMLLNSK